jgi:hypothetical protein
LSEGTVSRNPLLRGVAALSLLIPLAYFEMILLGVWMLTDGNSPLWIAIAMALVIGACSIFGFVKRRYSAAAIPIVIGWLAVAGVFAVSRG